jgi:hypothetical protein
VLLGIQPATVKMGEELSDPVRRVVENMSDDLCDLLMLRTDLQGVFVNKQAQKTSAVGAA